LDVILVHVPAEGDRRCLVLHHHRVLLFDIELLELAHVVARVLIAVGRGIRVAPRAVVALLSLVVDAVGAGRVALARLLVVAFEARLDHARRGATVFQIGVSVVAGLGARDLSVAADIHHRGRGRAAGAGGSAAAPGARGGATGAGGSAAS